LSFAHQEKMHPSNAWYSKWTRTESSSLKCNN
jgi:hypothetical protein